MVCPVKDREFWIIQFKISDPDEAVISRRFRKGHELVGFDRRQSPLIERSAKGPPFGHASSRYDDNAGYAWLQVCVSRSIHGGECVDAARGAPGDDETLVHIAAE